MPQFATCKEYYEDEYLRNESPKIIASTNISFFRFMINRLAGIEELKEGYFYKNTFFL